MQKSSVTYLRKKRKRLINQLREIETPLLRGSLIERYKRCGKSNCRCTKGQEHGPSYYLSVSMAGLRPILIYVPLEHKKAVEEALTNYREVQQMLEKLSDINRELLARRIAF
jgi:hypothetical protein